MSIPLVQNNEKDSINTSLIAIKRQIERINMLLGLSNSEEIDTSKFATKEELQQAVTDLQPVDEVTLDNMQSVTSNAVAVANSYSTSETFTGRYWIDGKKIYRRVWDTTAPTVGVQNQFFEKSISIDFPNIKDVISARGFIVSRNYANIMPLPYIANTNDWGAIYFRPSPEKTMVIHLGIDAGGHTGQPMKIILEYTKATD